MATKTRSKSSQSRREETPFSPTELSFHVLLWTFPLSPPPPPPPPPSPSPSPPPPPPLIDQRDKYVQQIPHLCTRHQDRYRNISMKYFWAVYVMCLTILCPEFVNGSNPTGQPTRRPSRHPSSQPSR